MSPALTKLPQKFLRRNGKQDPILFVIPVEESAHMTGFIELGTGKRDRSSCPLHVISPHRISSGAPWTINN